jgi:hypothetical protein
MSSGLLLQSLADFDPALRPTQPVLFKHGVAQWPALARWSPDYLRSKVGGERVRVSVSRTGEFRYQPDGSAMSPDDQYVIDDVLFDDVATWIAQEAPGAPKYYVTKFGFSEALPQALLGDLSFPDAPDMLRPTLWFGSAGTSSPLHFDAPDNLHCQIWGSKQWVLFAPDDSAYLYSYPERTKYTHLSQVDLLHPDLERFPLYARATPIEVELEPGDVIFVPAFWWHFVRSLSISISINRWWRQEIRQQYTPNALRLLRTQYRQSAAGSEQEAAITAVEWIETASAVLDRNPQAAVLMAGCAFQRLARGAASTAPELADRIGLHEYWDALLARALDPATVGISAEAARPCIERLRKTILEESGSFRAEAETGRDACERSG